jgi:hypothetical protein
MKKSIKVTFIFLLAVSLCLEPYDAYISGLCMIDLFLLKVTIKPNRKQAYGYI